MKFEIKKEKKENGIITVSVKMPYSEIEKKRETTLKRLAENIEIEGFRKGKSPIKMVEEKIGESKIIQEASQDVINEVFPEIIKKEKIHIIGYPSITVTKLASGNDFEFNMDMAVYPDIKLPDYKKIAKKIKIEKTEVTEKDIKKVEDNLIAMQNQMLSQNHDHKEGENCKHEEVKEELTDDFIKKLGAFKNVSEFREKMKEDLKLEKKNKVLGEHRGKIAEAIILDTKIEVPEILINAEVDKIVAQVKDDIQKSGQDFKELLKKQGKNDVEFRDSYKDEGEKRAKIEVILKEIAKVEKISVDKKESEQQIENIIKIHGKENLENIKLYVDNVLINEGVMKFLEKQSK